MSITFDGTDDYLKKDNVNILDDSGFNATSYTFTVSCWIRPDGRQNGGIWNQYDESAGHGRLGIYLLSSGKIRLRYGNSYRTTGSVIIAANSTTWYHIVSVFQYGSRELFVDSSSVHSHTGNLSSIHSTSGLDFNIGRAFPGSPGTAYYFDGDIAEWAAWKSVLSTGEMTSLYNGASPLFVRPGSMLAYYPMGGPYVGSSAAATGAYRDVLNANDLAEASSPAFAATPTQFSSSAGMFYPNTYMGNDTVPFTAAATEVLDETAITGDDVIHEIISANRRTQAGITVHSGGMNFNKRDNTDSIDAQVQVDELNDRFVESQRTSHNDVHG